MALPVIAPVCFLLLALAIVGAVTAGSVGIVFLATFVLVGGFVLALSVVTVQIDDGGIRARSPLGIQAIESALSEIEHVSVRDVKAFREFGGWGLRSSGRHGLGMILRSGPALILHQRSGQRLTLAVRDASAAARELERRGIERLPSST